jgi:hypothetical protein
MDLDFLYLKNKDNMIDNVFHDKILWNLIELNHISYLNHDEYSKNINILFNKNNKKEKL